MKRGPLSEIPKGLDGGQCGKFCLGIPTNYLLHSSLSMRSSANKGDVAKGEGGGG